MENYEKLKVLGQGSFGKVYLMRHKLERKLMCVKVIKIKSIPRKEREACRTEVELMKRLHHPNIVGYKDSFLTPRKDCLCIVMEYCDGGDLCSQIKDAKRKLFAESKILNLFVQMALGLHYMHSNRVLHRDLKTQNVFLLGNGRLVLGDLGISKVLDGTMDFASTCIGTPYYMSPEIFRNKPYNHKSDVWALGCILYEMTTLNHAFDSTSLNGLAAKIIKGKFPPINVKYSRSLTDLITSMLNITPSDRPDLDQVLGLPFIKKHIQYFLADIMSRENSKIGEGTMVVKAAAVNMLSGGQSVAPGGGHRDMLALQKQMEELGLQSVVARALSPPDYDRPTSITAAASAAREQASALRREEDRKHAVEQALTRLRAEREQRLKLRASNNQQVQQQPQDSQPPPPYSNHEKRPSGGAQAPGRRLSSGVPPAPPAVTVQKDRVTASNGRVTASNGPVRAVKDVNVVNNNVNNNVGYVKEKAPPQPPPRERRRTGNENEEREKDRRRVQDLNKFEQAREAERLAAGAIQHPNSNFNNPNSKDNNRESGAGGAMNVAALAAAALVQRRIRANANVSNVSNMNNVNNNGEVESSRNRALRRQREEQDRLRQDKLELDRKMADQEARALARKAREHSGAAPAELKAPTPSTVTSQLKRVDSGGSNISQKTNFNVEVAEPKVTSSSRKNVLQEPSSEYKVPGRPLQQQSSEPLFQPSRGNSNNPMGPEELSAMVTAAGAGKRRYTTSNSNAPTSSAARDEGERSEGEVSTASSTSDQFDIMDVYPNSMNNNDGIGEDGVDLAVEDIHRREEELQVELQVSTMRCAELRQSLRETKSILSKTPGGTKNVPGSFPKNRNGSAKNEEFSEETGENSDGILYESDYESEDSQEDKPERKVSPPVPQNVSRNGPRTPGGGIVSLADEAKAIDHSTVTDMYAAPGRSNFQDNYTTEYSPPMPSGTAQKKHPKSSSDSVNRASSKRSRDSSTSTSGNARGPQPTTTGRLGDRIQVLRRKCIDGLGEPAFMKAYDYLKELEDPEEDSDDENLHNLRGASGLDDSCVVDGLKEMLGPGKLHYYNLISQLIFIENTHSISPR